MLYAQLRSDILDTATLHGGDPISILQKKQNSCSKIQWLTIQVDDKQIIQTGNLKNSADSTCA